MESIRAEHSKGADNVISPFSESEVIVTQKAERSSRLFLYLATSLVLVVVGAVVAILTMRYVNDPYRTLAPFPVPKYFDSYQALAGSRYKADFRVEADLGWKDGAGRLILFSTTDDLRPVAVMIPVTVANGIYFTKGQTYTAEIEVKEGGLIYADSFEKN